MAIYINMKTKCGVETVDEFNTRKEGRKMLKEYRIISGMETCYLSSRPTKDWREASEPKKAC